MYDEYDMVEYDKMICDGNIWQLFILEKNLAQKKNKFVSESESESESEFVFVYLI